MRTGLRRVATLIALGIPLLLPATALGTSNLSIAHIQEKDPVVQETQEIYRFAVTNNGPDAATSVTVRVYVPAGMSPVFFSQESGPAFGLAFDGATFSATIANLPPSTTAVFSDGYTAKVPGSTTHTIQVVNPGPDPDLTNNQSVETTTILARGLSVSVADAQDPIQAGGNIEYTLTVRNRGAAAANGVTLTDALPASTTFVSLTTPAGWTAVTPPAGSAGQVTASIPTMAAESTASLTLVLAAPLAGALQNTATIAGTVEDGDPADNTDTETTLVNAPAPPPPTTRCKGKPATIVGTNRADTLKGTPGADVIAARGGKDVVRALGGNDVVCGGDGDDDLRGGGGKDELRGEGGKDTLKGGAGADKLAGGKGRDTCAGGAGKDSGGCEQRTGF